MILTYNRPETWVFLARVMPELARAERMATIALQRDETTVAAVAYEGINAHHCWMHMAVERAEAITRDFVRAAFAYPFLICKVERVRGYVEASNTAARSINERLGFRADVVLEGAAKDGGDVIVYAMRRGECRFLEG